MTESSVREQAAEFLDQLRLGVADLVKKDPKCFKHQHSVEAWNELKKQPVQANMEGWLPEIFPQYAAWQHIPGQDDELSDFSEHQLNWVINRSATPYPCFYPKYEGIPITNRLWEAIVSPGAQYLARLPDVGPFPGFKKVAEFWQKITRMIRSGSLDEYLIFSDGVAMFVEDFEDDDWFEWKHNELLSVLDEYNNVIDDTDDDDETG